MLHLIFKSPVELAVLQRICPDDEVVFLENSVLGLLRNGKLAHELAGLLTQCQLYALAADLGARGIADDELVSGITIIDYDGLVNVTINNPVIQSWT
ncbi:MAG: sulfurtransferase complex subunit TusB [Methylovulum sp.]|nr:sulfurtransferase complex subunit TusB [Methylovulum sp.]